MRTKPPSGFSRTRFSSASKSIKVNPDSPQRWVRKLALERDITVITPTPRLKGAFRRLDPQRIPKAHYAATATLKRAGAWGEDVALEALPNIDLVVMGSVAITRGGRRLGKGHGYADGHDSPRASNLGRFSHRGARPAGVAHRDPGRVN